MKIGTIDVTSYRRFQNLKMQNSQIFFTNFKTYFLVPVITQSISVFLICLHICYIYVYIGFRKKKMHKLPNMYLFQQSQYSPYKKIPYIPVYKVRIFENFFGSNVHKLHNMYLFQQSQHSPYKKIPYIFVYKVRIFEHFFGSNVVVYQLIHECKKILKIDILKKKKMLNIKYIKNAYKFLKIL